MKKVFLPKWVAWFVVLIFVIVISLTYYQTFVLNQKPKFDFYVSTLVLAFIAAVILYVSYKQVPYLLIGG